MALADAWRRYRARKSRKGIVVDFLFLAFVLVVLIPPARRGLMTQALRVTLMQPVRYDKVLYLRETVSLQTADGSDTLIRFPSQRPILLNCGSLTSPQSRAELKSLNKFATLYGDRVDVFHVSTDSPDEVVAYMNRWGYTSVRLLFAHSVADDPEVVEASLLERGSSVVAEMTMSEPSTMLVDKDGCVIIKKTGAARWSGKKVDAIVGDMLSR